MIEALLFDFNGVIADDEEQHRAALGVVLAGEGLSLTPQQYYSDFLGFDDRRCLIEAFRRAGKTLPPPQLDRLRPLPAGHCVVIEDSLPGLSAARAAGMRCAMLTTSHPSAALARAGADLVWSDFAGHDPAELLALAER